MKPKFPVQKKNLVVCPCECIYVYHNRYTWYICITMMIYTSLHEYPYPLIQRKSIPQTSLVIILTHTRTHVCTHAIDILPQNVLRRNCNGKCIEWIEGHYLAVMVEVYTWYNCIAMMIYTSLHEYPYPLIQRKSIPQTSLVIILTHTRTHVRTHAIVKI